MSPTDPSTSTFNNGSILAIESDLETIKEKELETFYPQTTSPNINDSLVVSSSSTASFHTNSIASSPSLNSFVQHLTFHLWLMLPILLLFIPSESKWMDRVLRNLLRKSNHALSNTTIMTTRSASTTSTELLEKQVQLQSSVNWTLGKMRLPLVITVVFLFSAIFGLLWAFLHIDNKDVSSSIVCGIIFWTGIGILICITKLTTLLIQWTPTKFDPEIEALYMDLCYPFHIERSDFAKILCSMKEIKIVKFGNDYITEHMTRVDRLSLVLSGRLLVRQSGKMLHVVPGLHFVDSPEWFGVATDEYFQISATALEETKVLIWHPDKLKLTLMQNPYLYTVFQHIIARDVVRKLIQSNDGTCLARDKILEQMEYDNLVSKNQRPRSTFVGKNGSVQLVHEEEVAYLNESWTLSRISEKDDEEIVSPI